jgi:predicted aldo/keto reductase-like oxidoreductase
MSRRTTRRNVLLAGAAALGAIAGTKWLRRDRPDRSSASTAAIPDARDSEIVAALPDRVLGKTQLQVPILGLGTGRRPFSQSGQDSRVIPLIRKSLELGITYFDTAADYGASEGYLGQVLPSARSQVVLASKTASSDRDGAWRNLERSLRRLNTDYLDIWQLHHVSFSEELDRIFSPSGAIRAVEEAKEQGLIRFAGITGHHDPHAIAEGLRRYEFDTALIPVNAADVHHSQPFIPTVMPVARQKNVGIVAMKVPAYGRLLQSGALKGMHEAMGYSLSVPGVHCCVIAADDLAMLEENVRIARQFQQLDKVAMGEIEQRAASVWSESTFFRAWT